MRPPFLRGTIRTALASLLALSIGMSAAHAATEAEMQKLGRAFAEKIGGKLNDADALLAGQESLRYMELKTGAVIPDGEPIILRAFLGPQSLPLEREILSVRQGDRLLMSLADLCIAIEFPISVSPQDGTATGWFIREDKTFYLDAKKGEVLIAGVSQPLTKGDIAVDADNVMVSHTLLENWFGLKMRVDTSSLAVNITATPPLPIEDKERRKKQRQYDPMVDAASQKAQHPLQAEPYHVFTKPYMDVVAGVSSVRPDNNTSSREAASWSAVGSNDLFGLSSRIFASGGWSDTGNEEALNALRLTLGRQDEDGVFGFEGIRTLEFGDVTTLNLPLILGGEQEQGIYLSNRVPGNITTLSRTDIQGDWQPGWDVELYNNESLIGLQTIGDDGRYDFPAVFLFEGENVMRLVFYGPHGEIREETRRIGSFASSLKKGEGKWETSLTRSNITTYNANEPDSPIDGDPRLTARYEYSFGPQASANIGVMHRSETDGAVVEQKDYLQAGVAASVGGTLMTGDVAVDNDGEYMADVLARRSFGLHQTALEVAHSSGQFSQGGLLSYAPENLVQANVRGPLAQSFLGLSNVTYTADAGYRSFEDTTKSLTTGAGISGRAGNVTLSSSLAYARSEFLGVGAPTDTRLSGTTTARGFIGKGRWRLGTTYGLMPYETRRLNAGYTYPFTRKIQGTADITHDISPDVTELRLSGRWRHDKFSLNPHVEIDTNDRLAMGLSVNFSLADDPYGEGYEMFNRNLTDTGGVSARVFLDRNGDGKYGEGDELLPDVTVQSVQAGRSAATGKSGVAFIPSLQRAIRTDIVVPPENLPDPYYMPSVAGASVVPRPGVTTQLDFPVVVAGEIDGQVSFANSAKTPRGVTVKLLTPDGVVAYSSPVPYDGYYTISGIRPGVYYLMADGAGGHFAPKVITFKSEGTSYFGQNVVLEENGLTHFTFTAANASPAAAQKGRIVRQEDIAGRAIFIHAGEYRSRVAYLLAKYRFRMMSGPWEGMFTEVEMSPRPSPDTGVPVSAISLKPLRPVTMPEAVNTCRALEARTYNKCTIEVVTSYLDPAPPVPPAAPPIPKKTAEIEPVTPAAPESR